VTLAPYFSEGHHRPNSGARWVTTADQLGSVRDVLEAATGALLASFDYTPYGQVKASSGSVMPDYMYAGLMLDGDTGLYYSDTRLYNYGIGRWVSRDTVAETGGINLFGYVGGSPVARIDRDGDLWGWVAVAGVVAVVHWTRNYWNDDVSLEDAKKSWTEMPPEKSIWHRMGPGNEGNRKFVSPSGHSEAVFDKNGCPVTDSLNEGTFNFAPPDLLWGLPHAALDVAPYFVLGNSPGDMFTTERFTAPFSKGVPPKQSPIPVPQPAQ
jgi:RHS repeat-associated protein